MKKIMVRLFLVLVVLLVLAAIAVHFFLDDAIKRGVETIGPKLTKTDVKLDAVSLSLLSGSGKIKGLLVGNPEGFKQPQAIKLGSASLSVVPGSVFDRYLRKADGWKGRSLPNKDMREHQHHPIHNCGRRK